MTNRFRRSLIITTASISTNLTKVFSLSPACTMCCGTGSPMSAVSAERLCLPLFDFSTLICGQNGQQSVKENYFLAAK